MKKGSEGIEASRVQLQNEIKTTKTNIQKAKQAISRYKV